MPVSRDFSTAATGRQSKQGAPFSLRLTASERAALQTAAGDMPLGAYIRSRLLGAEQHQPRRAGRVPKHDHAALGQALGELGRSRLANNLNQLAKAVNTGSLPVTPDTEKEIRDACAAVQRMRAELLRALGFVQGDEP